jgi:hypothetical protein
MTRRKSGLPAADQSADGLTSLCNTSESAVNLRERALEVDKSIKLAQRYETITLTDLAAWPLEYKYTSLPNTLKKQIREYYKWQQIRDGAAAACYHTTRAGINLQFDQLDDTVHDKLAAELCDIHTVIMFTLHVLVIPEYIAFHTLGGEQTVHWESIPSGSDISSKRQLVLDRMNSMQAGSRTPGTPGLLVDYYGWSKENNDVGILHLLYRDLPNSKHSQKIDDDEDDDDIKVAHRTATLSRSPRSIASGYVRAMHTAVVVLGREAHPRSIVCPITSPEWQTLVKGYSIPEDMLQGHLVTHLFKRPELRNRFVTSSQAHQCRVSMSPHIFGLFPSAFWAHWLSSIARCICTSGWSPAPLVEKDDSTAGMGRSCGPSSKADLESSGVEARTPLNLQNLEYVLLLLQTVSLRQHVMSLHAETMTWRFPC